MAIDNSSISEQFKDTTRSQKTRGKTLKRDEEPGKKHETPLSLSISRTSESEICPNVIYLENSALTLMIYWWWKVSFWDFRRWLSWISTYYPAECIVANIWKLSTLIGLFNITCAIFVTEKSFLNACWWQIFHLYAYLYTLFHPKMFCEQFS